MALIKTEEQLSGFSVSYWKIIIISIKSNGIEVRVGGYLDKNSRDTGKEPAEHKGFLLSGYDLAELDELNKNPYSIAYSKLRAETEFFVDAVDDI
jgi:hypothetical protein